MNTFLYSQNSKKTFKKSSNQSFTFINMLIVIVITGFIPAMTMPLVVSNLNLDEHQDGIKVAKMQSDPMQYLKLISLRNLRKNQNK